MNRLKLLRIEANKSMAQVAREINMPYTTYVNYEKDNREPNSETLIQFADYFGVSVDYLIGRSNNRQDKDLTDCNKEKLMHNYALLNSIGKNKLVEYSDDLIKSGSYIEKISTITAARSNNNNKPIRIRSLPDLSQFEPDDTEF